jgi:putative lipoprotein
MPPPWPDRRAALRLLAAGTVLALAACGRKGAPLAPYDVDPCYPRHYPLAPGAKAECAQKEEYAREHPPQPPPKKGAKQPVPAAPPPTEPPSAPEPPSDRPQDQPPANPPTDSKPQ